MSIDLAVIVEALQSEGAHVSTFSTPDNPVQEIEFYFPPPNNAFKGDNLPRVKKLAITDVREKHTSYEWPPKQD